jgi:hypothetical protein
MLMEEALTQFSIGPLGATVGASSGGSVAFANARAAGHLG